MEENYFYKQSKITQEDIETNSRLRNNAFVTVTANDSGFRLPVTNNTMAGTYNPEGTGRAAPVLKDVKISLQGEAGSLRRAEISFTCFDMTSFQKAEEAFLIPGSEITIHYGYAGPEQPSQSGKHVFRVYDYSFKITKENYFDCSFKAVAKGTGAEYDLIDILSGTDKFSALELKFITDFDGFDEVSPVQSMFDYIDYQIQVVTETDIKSAESDTYTISLGSYTINTGIGTANAFDPPHGKCGRMPDGGHYGILKAPDAYSPSNRIDGGFLEKARITYVTLGAVVAVINKFILAGNENNYQIKFGEDLPGPDKNPALSALDTTFPAGRVWSPSPHKTLFPYAKGTPENSYTPSAGETDLEKFITCDSFADFDSTAYDEFRLDKSSTASPKGILLTRDVLREIQKSFDDKAINEDLSVIEREKAKAKIDLNAFFKKIFAVIRDNSGGDWDLSLETLDELKSEPPPSYTPIVIVNKKAPLTSKVKALILRPAIGKNGIRELKLSGQIPQDIQAEAFGGAPSIQKTAVDIIAENEAELAKAQKDHTETIKRLKKDVPAAQSKINDSSYSHDATTAAKGLVKELVEALTPDDLASRGKLLAPTPYPLTVSVTLDGIEGFRFGDTITSNYLPARYRPKNGSRVVFTVTEYIHTIKDNDWQTDLSCVSRIVKDD